VADHRRYEGAFESLLRRFELPYVRVNQFRRPIVDGLTVKNFDFLVRAAGGEHYIVDVKGKLFPYAYGRKRVYWENWLATDDLEGLARWERYFEDRFPAVLAYVYEIRTAWDEAEFDTVVRTRGGAYGIVAVTLADYIRHARPRSPLWRALNIPKATFKEIARDARTLFAGGEPASELREVG